MSVFPLDKYQIRQLSLFLLGGVVFAGVDIGLLVCLKERAGIDVLISASVSFTIATVLNYFFNAWYVFPLQGKRITRKSFFLFVLVSILSLGINDLAIALLTQTAHISYLLAKLIAVGFVLVWTFLVRKYVIFKVSP